MLATLDRLITPARARVAAVTLLAIYLATTLGWLASAHNLIDGFHQPLGGDFIIFYSASRMTLHGQGALAFDPSALLAVQRTIIPAVRSGLEWCYPPTFQLLIAPLSLVPFGVAYGLFLLATFIPFLLVVQMIVPGRMSLAMTCAFPGTFVNAWGGQNGFLTTAALGWGLISLDRRPWLAGAALGLLVYKPQFGVLLPLLLVGTGRWKSTLAAALSAAAFIGLSVLVLGVSPWMAFFRNLPAVSASLASGSLPWSKIASVFVAARWLGAPAPVAYGLQAIVALAVAGVTLLIWRRPGDLGLKAGLAVLATFLVSPYSFNYDLALLAVPIAATVRHGREHPLPTGVKSALLLAAMTPDLFLGIAKLTHVQLMPLAIGLCWLALARCALAQDGAARASEVWTGAEGALV